MKKFNAYLRSNQKPTLRVYKDEERQPYMNTQIDLSFPDIQNKNKGRIVLDQMVSNLNMSLPERRSAERHMGKINNVPRTLEEYHNVLSTVSVPRDYTRNTLISKDNFLYYKDRAE